MLLRFLSFKGFPVKSPSVHVCLSFDYLCTCLLLSILQSAKIKEYMLMLKFNKKRKNSTLGNEIVLMPINDQK